MQDHPGGMVVCGGCEVQSPKSKLQSPESKIQSPKYKVQSGVEGAESPVVYLDELSTFGQSTVAEFYQDRGFALSVFEPEFALQPATLADLKGGDRAANAEIIRRILRGIEVGPKRDAVLLNTGAALFVAGKSRTLADGWTLAAETIDSGRAIEKLEELRKAFPRIA